MRPIVSELEQGHLALNLSDFLNLCRILPPCETGDTPSLKTECFTVNRTYIATRIVVGIRDPEAVGNRVGAACTSEVVVVCMLAPKVESLDDRAWSMPSRPFDGTSTACKGLSLHWVGLAWSMSNRPFTASRLHTGVAPVVMVAVASVMGGLASSMTSRLLTFTIELGRC